MEMGGAKKTSRTAPVVDLKVELSTTQIANEKLRNRATSTKTNLGIFCTLN